MELIISEDFQLSPSVRRAVKENIDRIQLFIRKELPIKVSLSKGSRGAFKTQMMLHYHGKDLVTHGSSKDFRKSLAETRSKLIRSILRQKKKSYSKSSSRRSPLKSDRLLQNEPVQSDFEMS